MLRVKVVPRLAKLVLQVALIRKALDDQGISKERVEVFSVDSAQGQEFDRVILSCVVSGQQRSFLEDRRRMNVAISRAKKTLDVVGHPTLPHNNVSIGALHASAGGVEVAVGQPVTLGNFVGHISYNTRGGRGRGRGRGHGRGRGW